jgi:prepilin-type N-terminal cleavage/methylation domain-containing protein
MRRHGFTLVEVVVVLGILALVAAFTVPAFLRDVEPDDMTRAERRVEALFKLARDSAIRGGVPVTVVIDSVSGRVWLDVPPSPSVIDSLTDLATVAGVGVGTIGVGTRVRLGGLTRGEAVDVGESLELPQSIRLHLSSARARFTFSPGGSAFADSLVLFGRSDSVLVTVHPWTADAVFR